MIRRVALGVVVGVLAATSACTGDKKAVDTDPTLAPGPQRSELVATADLDRCPRSVDASVDGGLPDVTLPCLGNGPAVHLAGMRGKPLVVNIWGSWCIPCRKEMTYLAQASSDLQGRVLFLGVDSVDSADSALDFVAHVRPRLHYASVYDDDKQVLLGLNGPIAMPSTVFVDADGSVTHRKFGEYTSLDALRSDIERYLGVPA